MDKEEPKTAEEKTPIKYKKLSSKKEPKTAPKRYGYFQGTSVKKLLALAEKGDKYAAYSLGRKYRDGEGVPQSYQEAVKWIRRAANQGNARAQSSLGWMYKDGEGCLSRLPTSC